MPAPMMAMVGLVISRVPRASPVWPVDGGRTTHSIRMLAWRTTAAHFSISFRIMAAYSAGVQGGLRRDDAVRAGAVVDDDRLAQQLGQALDDDARRLVDRAAGREGHDEPQWSGRICGIGKGGC